MENERGAASFEFLISAFFFVLISLACLELTLVMASKHLVNFSAYQVARTFLDSQRGDSCDDLKLQRLAKIRSGLMLSNTSPLLQPTGSSSRSSRYPLALLLTDFKCRNHPAGVEVVLQYRKVLYLPVLASLVATPLVVNGEIEESIGIPFKKLTQMVAVNLKSRVTLVYPRFRKQFEEWRVRFLGWQNSLAVKIGSFGRRGWMKRQQIFERQAGQAITELLIVLPILSLLFFGALQLLKQSEKQMMANIETRNQLFLAGRQKRELSDSDRLRFNAVWKGEGGFETLSRSAAGIVKFGHEIFAQLKALQFNNDNQFVVDDAFLRVQLQDTNNLAYGKVSYGFHPDEYNLEALLGYFLVQYKKKHWSQPFRRQRFRIGFAGSELAKSIPDGFVAECMMHFVANSSCKRFPPNWFALMIRLIGDVKSLVQLVADIFSGSGAEKVNLAAKELYLVLQGEFLRQMEIGLLKKFEQRAGASVTDKFVELRARFSDELNQNNFLSQDILSRAKSAIKPRIR